MKTAIKLLQPGALGLSSGGGVSPPVISFGSGSGYAGSTYSVTSGDVGEWWIDGAASGITATSFVESLANEGKPRYWRRADGILSNTIEMWVPSDVAGLSVLLDARQGITQSGGLVSEWVNQVGGVNPANATSAQQPVYDPVGIFGTGPALIFDGLKFLPGMSGGAINPAARTHIVAARFTDSAASRTLFSGMSASGPYELRRTATTNVLAVVSNAVAVRCQSTTPIPNNVSNVLVARTNPPNGAYDFRANGVNIGNGTMTGGFTTTSSIRIGGDPAGSARMIGGMSTHIVYEAFLSDLDTYKAEAYAHWTLGGQASLDAAHLYRNAPPRLQ